MDDEPLIKLTPANAVFAVLPGLALMFALAPALEPALPMPVTGLIAGIAGAITGLVTYRFVADKGLAVRICALTVLCLFLGGGALLVVQGLT
jgi:hypothetical protein